MKKLFKGLFAFILAASVITCVPVENVDAAVYAYAIDRSEWSVSAYNYDATNDVLYNQESSVKGQDGPASYMIDDDRGTRWHTCYGNDTGASYTAKPVYVFIKFSDDLSKSINFESLSWENRSQTAAKDWKLYINNSNEEAVLPNDPNFREFWGAEDSPVASGSFAANKVNYAVLDEAVNATQIMIEIANVSDSSAYVSCQDFNLYDFDIVNNEQIVIEESSALDSSAFVLTESGNSNEDGVSTSNVLDGNPTTYWTSQSVSTVSDGSAWLQINMGELKTINRIDLTKRYDETEKWACTGNIREYVIEVSKTGEDGSWTTVSSADISYDEDKTIYNSQNKGGTYAIEFDSVNTQYIRIKANKSYHSDSTQYNTCITIGDLKVYGVHNELLESTVKFSTNETTTISAGDTTLEETTDVSAFKGLEEGSVNITAAATGTGLQSIFAFGDSGQANHYFSFYIWPANNKVGVESRGDTNGYLVNSSVVKSMDYTQEHAYSLVWKKNASNYTCTIYVDGEEILSATSSYGFSMDDYSEMNYVAFGKAIRSTNAKAYPFTGTMKNIEFYNKAIHESQIKDYTLPLSSSVDLQLNDYKLDGVDKSYVLSANEISALSSLASGTINITYRLSDATINKNMVLFSVSNNTADNQCYAVWVNPVTGKFGVNLNGNEDYAISSNNVKNTDWHTITIRNGTLNSANGMHLSIDGTHTDVNRYTGSGRTGFYTLVSGANTATIGYIDQNTADEKEFVGEIAAITLSSTVITDAQLATAHSDALAATEMEDVRWSDTYLENKNYIYESSYNTFGAKPIAITSSTLASNYILKYVNKNVLSVKAQAKLEDDGQYKLRFVTSVASLNPEACGFEYVIMNGETEFASSYKDCSTVFTSIKAEDSFVDPKVVFENEVSEYFATFSLVNVPSTVGSYTITLKPYWIPYGSTEKVYGVEKTYTLQTLFDTAPTTANE